MYFMKPLKYIRSVCAATYEKIGGQMTRVEHPLYVWARIKANRGDGAYIQMMAQQFYAKHG